MPETILADEGTLTLTVRRSDGSEHTCELDLMQAKLAAETVETRHGASAEGWAATPEFLGDLAKAFEKLGVSPCTPTVAYRVWHRVTELWVDLKKNMLGPATSPNGTGSTPTN